MKIPVLYAAVAIVLPLALYGLVSEAFVPLWLILPALGFALGIGAVVVFHQWLRVIGFGVLRLVGAVAGLTLLTTALLAVMQTAAAEGIVWPLLVAAAAVLLVTLLPHASSRRTPARARA